jgi:hypothetical protein
VLTSKDPNNSCPRKGASPYHELYFNRKFGKQMECSCKQWLEVELLVGSGNSFSSKESAVADSSIVLTCEIKAEIFT